MQHLTLKEDQFKICELFDSHKWRYVDFMGREFWMCIYCKKTEDVT